MKTRKLLHVTCIALVTTIYLPVGKLSVKAQDGNRLTPAIQMVIEGDANETRQRTSQSGIMDPIGVFRDEQVGVNLLLPGSMINYPVGIAPLDGGEIIASENLTVDNDRTAHFSFKGGETPGLYRVLVTIASQQYQLQFYVSSSSSLDIHCTPP
jgi:hypothetical protein